MPKQFEHGYALLIAVDQNAEPQAALPDVAKDVSALRDVLIHPNLCGYLTANIRVIAAEKSTR